MLFSTILKLSVVCRALSLSAERTRRSILRPWKGGPDLGYSVEIERQQKNEQVDLKQVSQPSDNLLQISIGWNNNNNNNNNNEGEETAAVEDALKISLPDLGKGGGLASNLWPAALATSILMRSPAFRSFAKGKDILELGSGLGLVGLVAAEESAKCILTDNDKEAVDLFDTTTFPLNQDVLKADLLAKRIEWRDKHEDVEPVDIVLGSDIAYYYFLLRPLMDTARAYLRPGAPLLIVAGQANRQCQWDLYKNIRYGCYNQLTDEHEPPWPGQTKMLLYNLEMRNEESQIDGVIPMAVIIHHNDDLVLPPFTDYDYEATQEDDDNMLKTF
jgi:predicted nicotinamide N-methyase